LGINRVIRNLAGHGKNYNLPVIISEPAPCAIKKNIWKRSDLGTGRKVTLTSALETDLQGKNALSSKLARQRQRFRQEGFFPDTAIQAAISLIELSTSL
jgi:hypothetical protein